MNSTCPTDALRAYYRFHAHIYDATRWSFLFGRRAMVRLAARAVNPTTTWEGAPPGTSGRTPRVLEVGCGTGRNLLALAAALPAAHITGVDLCAPMLEKARKAVRGLGARIELRHQAYDADLFPAAGFDLVLFSYALTMFNPGFERALDAARQHLTPDGRLAVVDCHDSPLPLFTSWMRANHVRMDGQILPAIETRFAREHVTIHRAYGGVWRYVLCLARTT